MFFQYEGLALKQFTDLQRGILLIAIMVVVAIAMTTYLFTARLSPEKTLPHQGPLSPAIELVTEHVLQPLHIAETLSHSASLVELLSEPVDKAPIVEELTRLKHNFGIEFFMASELARYQYFSSGREHSLKEGETNWYFELKHSPDKTIADVGRWDEPQFFIDIKILDEDKRFLGFFGTAQKLDTFVTLFDEYKEQYGYHFIFVDQNDRIMLSSDQNLSPKDSAFKSLNDLAWFRQWQKDHPNQILNSSVIKSDSQNYLITDVSVSRFGWRVLILSPVETQISPISQLYFLAIALFVLAILAAFGLLLRALNFYKSSVDDKISTDALTGLVNRVYIQEYYEQLDPAQPVSIIVLDLDRFKAINDDYGHNMGDKALISVSKRLRSYLSSPNILCRWGGEEFLILMPNANLEEATILANSMCDVLAVKPFNLYNQLFPITGSFGVASAETKPQFARLFDRADKALYKAKRNGRNRVEISTLRHLNLRGAQDEAV